MLTKKEIEEVLSYDIAKEIIIYFLNLINKRNEDITSPIKLSLNPNTQIIKKCLTSLYCPDNINGEIEAERHINKCINLNIFKIDYKDKRHTFPLYKRKAILTFNQEFEYQLRQYLDMNLSLYNNEWVEAINSSQIQTDKKDLLKKLTPIEFGGKSAIKVITRIESYLSLNRSGDFIREASAFMFWGHSKLLDSKVDYWDFFKLMQKPIQIITYVSSIECRNILFIENEQTFESLKKKHHIVDKYILIFLSGFMGTASRLMNKDYRSFYKDSKKGVFVEDDFLNSIFDNQNEFNYLFWGDLDYEGINIYLVLKKTFPKVKFWKYAYDIMKNKLLESNGHDALDVEKENQKKPKLIGSDYIDNILIPTMEQYGFFDQEGVLL